jgi:hypothetical protein
MNRKLAIASLGLLGLIGLGNVARCVDREEPSQGCSIEENEELSTKVSVSEAEINVKADVERLKAKYPLLTEFDLKVAAKMIYFEGFPDSKLSSEEDYRESFTGIAEVIRNRYLFDNCVENPFFENGFCGINHFDGENSFRGILSKKNYDSQNKTYEHQFSSWNFKKKYFDSEAMKSLYSPDLNKQKLDLAYRTFVHVLESDSNIVHGALWYKNNQASDNMNNRRGAKVQRWHGQPMITIERNKSKETCKFISHFEINPQQNIECRLEKQLIADNDNMVIGSHNYYRGVLSETEYVWNNTARKTYKWQTPNRG